jgi:hypothetical protein
MLVMFPCLYLSKNYALITSFFVVLVPSAEVPAFRVFLGNVLALRENEIKRELMPRLFCDPTAVPILTIG